VRSLYHSTRKRHIYISYSETLLWYHASVARRARAETWAERGFKNAGIITTSRALKFALGWGLFMASEGHEPTNIEEYAEVMQESRATAFRDQQAFRQAYPDEENPTRMNKVTGAQDRYNDLYKTIQDYKKFVREAQPLVYLVGGAPAV